MKPTFATFWHGPAPSPYEIACLTSFTDRGYEVTVYSFGSAQFPAPLQHGNAHDIVAEKTLTAFIVAGKPCVTHFTDYFRFHLFRKTDHIWIDADILLLRDFDMDINGNIYGRERDDSICTAVLKLKRDEKLDAIISRVEALMGKDVGWSATGPKLLTEIYGAHSPDVLAQNKLYPITIHDFYKFLLPEFRAECERNCAEAYTLHLWNHVFAKAGVWKQACPPEGSFLHDYFHGHAPFVDCYPDTIMRTTLYNALIKIDRTVPYRRIVAVFVRRLMIKMGLSVKAPNIVPNAWREAAKS